MDFRTDFKPLTVDPDKIYEHSFATILEEYIYMILRKMNGKSFVVLFMLQRISI